MSFKNGIFVISLDFELYWGVRYKKKIEDYQENLDGTKGGILSLLNLFKIYNIHATWATVGFLFFNDIDHLKLNYPNKIPQYKNNKLCPYKYLEKAEHIDPKYHFAPDIISIIAKQDGQEIGCHTFSHIYTNDPGITLDTFREDIISAKKIAESKGIVLRSLVFPRNMVRTEYLSILRELDLSCYRGNPNNFLYYPYVNSSLLIKLQKIARLIDSYIMPFPNNRYSKDACKNIKPFNIPQSRFLRPYSRHNILNKMQLIIIYYEMMMAAKENKLYHLWWHPHNIGQHTNENIHIIKSILNYYNYFSKKYGMKSFNMIDVASILER